MLFKGFVVYNKTMIKIIVGENDKNQRLDRFLRKYYNKASLSFIYKMIRKDVKVNGNAQKMRLFLMRVMR